MTRAHHQTHRVGDGRFAGIVLTEHYGVLMSGTATRPNSGQLKSDKERALVVVM